MESDLRFEVRYTLTTQVALEGKASHVIEIAQNQRVGWKRVLDCKVK